MLRDFAQPDDTPIRLLVRVSRECCWSRVCGVWQEGDPRAEHWAVLMTAAPEVAEVLAGEVLGIATAPEWGTTIARMREWSGCHTTEEIATAQEKDREQKRREWVERQDNPDRGRSYGQAALVSACQDVVRLDAGRHTEVNRLAWKIGQLVGGGVVDADAAVAELTQAAVIAGLREAEAKRIVTAAIRRGAQQPRVPR